MPNISFSFRPRNPKEGDYYFDILSAKFLKYDGNSWNVILNQDEIDNQKSLFERFKNTKLGRKLFKSEVKYK